MNKEQFDEFAKELTKNGLDITAPRPPIQELEEMAVTFFDFFEQNTPAPK